MKILFLFTSTIYYFCALMILSNSFNIKCLNKKSFFCLLSSTAITAPAFWLNESTFIILSTAILFVHTILIHIFFRKIKYTSILYTYTLLYSINACISSYIVISFNLKNLVLSDTIANSVTFLICFIFLASRYKYKITQIASWIPKYIKLLILCISVSEMFLLSLLLNKSLYLFTKDWFNSVQFWVASLSLFSLIIIILFIILAIRNTILKQTAINFEQQIKIQAEHYQKIAKSNREINCFRHDFKNISIAIEQLINKGNYSEALFLIKRSNDKLLNSENKSNKFKTGNSIADALLSEKQINASNINTFISFEGIIPSECLSPTDICIILGNALDNAIEACNKLPVNESKRIKIESFYSCNILFITITNPISELVNIKNNHIPTTKHDKTLHGFGLYSIKTIVNKYCGTLNLNSTNSTFTINMSFNLAA